MELREIFLLYSDHQPLNYEIKDTSRDESDFRQAVIADWGGQKSVIKIADNDFTTASRLKVWKQAADAYRTMGYYAPRVLANQAGNLSAQVEYSGRKCLVFAEEFSAYQTARQAAEQLGEKCIWRNGRHVFHDDAIRFLGRIGAARLGFAEHPSGLCILEQFCPSDETDEIMECALDFKRIIETRLPQYEERFQRIWNRFLLNCDALRQIYGQLPTSVFQADLNDANILLDEQLCFIGVLDFNLCGRDTVLNILFREAWCNFDEDVPSKRENNIYYVEDSNRQAFQSFVNNLMTMKAVYPFTTAEKRAAPLLYRYLRPFWWQPLHALERDKDQPEKVARILAWIEREQVREIDFQSILS